MKAFDISRYSIELEATGERISKLMQKNKMRAKDLADFLGISVQSISKWCHGVTLPSMDNLVILAELFHVSIEEILVLRHQLEKDAEQEKNWILRKAEQAAQQTLDAAKRHGSNGKDVGFVLRRDKKEVRSELQKDKASSDKNAVNC